MPHILNVYVYRIYVRLHRGQKFNQDDLYFILKLTYLHTSMVKAGFTVWLYQNRQIYSLYIAIMREQMNEWRVVLPSVNELKEWACMKGEKELKQKIKSVFVLEQDREKDSQTCQHCLL